jgi:hypothetical protein
MGGVLQLYHLVMITRNQLNFEYVSHIQAEQSQLSLGL